MRLQLATPDDREAGVQDAVDVPGICGPWIVDRGREMPVITEVGISKHLKALPDLGVQHDSFRPCGLEVLEKVDHRVPMRRPWILVEAGALMRHIDDFGTSAILEKVELSHD